MTDVEGRDRGRGVMMRKRKKVSNLMKVYQPSEGYPGWHPRLRRLIPIPSILTSLLVQTRKIGTSTMISTTPDHFQELQLNQLVFKKVKAQDIGIEDLKMV